MIDITKTVSAFVQESPLNFVPDLENMRIFEVPLIGVADARDSLFNRLKDAEVVGQHHFMPKDWLPSAVSVISYFLPFTDAVRKSNRASGLPSVEWLYGRIEGEQFNRALMSFIADKLISDGYKAVAPSLDSRFVMNDIRSNWSERHIAYIAGLGTFSLNCSLITSRGAAGRLGSVVTDMELPRTAHAYTEVREYCNNCGACIRRCPPNAIDENGKNHQICSDYLKEMIIRFNPRYGCGKCQTGVPCEDCIPEK